MPFHGSLFFWGSCCRFIRFIIRIIYAIYGMPSCCINRIDESDETAATAPKEKRAMKRPVLEYILVDDSIMRVMLLR